MSKQCESQPLAGAGDTNKKRQHEDETSASDDISPPKRVHIEEKADEVTSTTTISECIAEDSVSDKDEMAVITETKEPVVKEPLEALVKEPLSLKTEPQPIKLDEPVPAEQSIVSVIADVEKKSDDIPTLSSWSKIKAEDIPVNLSKAVKSEATPKPVTDVGNIVIDVDDIKENVIEDDTPMDLSQGAKSFAKQTASCNGAAERRFRNGLDSIVTQESIKRLRESLRNEETLLLLMKKIRQSQIVHRAQDSVVQKAAAMNNGMSAVPPSAMPHMPRLPAHSSQPMPTNLTTVASNRVAPSVRPEPARVSAQVAAVPRPQPPHIPQAASAPVLGPRQPIVRPPVPAVREAAYRPAPVQPPPAPEPSLQQRQAAAKLQLRRQLEATLLQIPPPKPAPPEINFIPSVASVGDFLVLLGLEEAVSRVVDSSSGSDPVYIKPFECAQCHTDFTPIWKRERPGSDVVVCERCASTAQKRALKQEHTERLKAAFVRALQQERELERSLEVAASGSLAPSPSASPFLSGGQRILVSESLQRSSSSSGSGWRNASSSRLVSVAGSFQPMMPYQMVTSSMPGDSRQHHQYTAAVVQHAQSKYLGHN